jgi:hypothetical protein
VEDNPPMRTKEATGIPAIMLLNMLSVGAALRR